MKKILVLSTFLLIPQLILAAQPAKNRMLPGLYVKAGVGDTIAQFKSSHNSITDIINPSGVRADTLNQSVNHDTQGTQFAGLLGLGYLYQINSLWVISAEMTANFTSVNSSYKNNDKKFSDTFVYESTTNMNYYNDFALLVKPGLAIQHRTQFYALLGARWGNFRTATDLGAAVFSTSVYDSVENSGYELGVTVGLGVERMLTRNWGVALEYAYTSYGKIPSANLELNYSTPQISGTFITTDDFSGNAATNTLMLEITHRFW